MQGEVLALIVALAACVFFVFMGGGRIVGPRRRGSWRPRWDGRPDLTDVGQQMNAVMGAQFKKQKLLSLAEYDIFKLIESDVERIGRGYRIFAQVNLGEILTSSDNNAYRSINSKRVDMLIVDGGGWPILAVEYQGDGHYQGTAAARDAVKKEAFRKAGVGYLEVNAGDKFGQIQARVREQLGWHATLAEADGQLPAKVAAKR